MVLVFVVLISMYAILLLYAHGVWVRVIRQQQFTSGQESALISVIIPVRNEAENIGQLLEDLQKQDYPCFEVLVVDDHSVDCTVANVKQFSNHKDIRLIQLNAEYEGKKQAITTGVNQARGSIVVTTDADCRVSGNWLSTISKCFDEPSVKFVFGGVRIRQQNSFWASLQAVEFASLVGSGVVAFALNKPVMCNGANLAFRKEIFEEVQGYTGNYHIASGDDVFLMNKVRARFPDGLRFNALPGGVVETSPQVTLMDFMHQRIRWAGKWRSHRSGQNHLLAFGIFAFYSLLILLGGVLVSEGHFVVFGLGLLIKLIAESFFLRSVMSFLESEWNWFTFLLAGLLYPLYAVFFGILSNFSSYRWKGRKFFRPVEEIYSGIARID